MRGRSWLVGVATASLLTLAAPQLAATAPVDDPRAEREQVRAERARVAARIDTSQASLAEIDAALATLADNVRTQEAALARTEEQVAQAERDITNAEAAIARLSDEIAVLRAEMTRRAVDAYVNPPAEDLLSVLDTDDFTSVANRKFYVELRAQDDADVADRLAGVTDDIEHARSRAAEARQRAEERRAEQAERVESVRTAKAQQEQVSADLESDIDAQVARSVELAATDAALSKEIAERQAALVARLAQQQAEREEAERVAAVRRAAAQQAQQSEAARTVAAPQGSPPSSPAPSNQAPGGGETAPLPPVSTGNAGTGTGGIKLCRVGGITVSCNITGPLQRLLDAARADGLSLTGGGYRGPEDQIRLRRAHCGSSHYAIYQMPASACRPPTGIPGTSQHEIGLAIDFSNCSSRSTRCYQWLAANAGNFGFKNLPSEPWHWSTTGG